MAQDANSNQKNIGGLQIGAGGGLEASLDDQIKQSMAQLKQGGSSNTASPNIEDEQEDEAS